MSGGRTARTAIVLALVRAALLVIVFHTSGLAHFAADVHEIVTTGRHAATALDPDDDAPWQTPGSPSCHHAQPGAASMGSSVQLPSSPPARRVVRSWLDARMPPSPPPSSVYRPPRV
jgi:hypothetical protein